MSTKIRLMRMGKIRSPHYRVVITDSRAKRDGRAIETIGLYHPKEDPSYIEIDGARALHWLKVGAQPTEAVAALLRVTGTWQEFRGLPAPEPMKVKPAKADKRSVFEAATKDAMQAPAEAAPRRTKAAAPATEVVAEPAADVVAEPAADVVAEPAADVVAEPAADVVAEPAAEAVEPAAETTETTEATE